MQIVIRPKLSPDSAASPARTRNRTPKHSSKWSGENLGAARDQTSAKLFEEWRHISSRIRAGRSMMLDSKERTIGSNGTRFKRGISHVLWTDGVFESSGLKKKSISCKSVQNRRSNTGFDSLEASISTESKRKARDSQGTRPVLQKTRQAPLEDDLCFSRDIE